MIKTIPKKRILFVFFFGLTINMGKYITETKDYYECERCNVDTATENRLCPCNRRVCEAVKKGRMTTTKIVTFDDEMNLKRSNLDSDDIGQMMASMNL